MKYTVLMSVYQKDHLEYVMQACDSMFSQTLPPDQFLIVCDGVLPEELNEYLVRLEKAYEIVEVVRLSENRGLGKALNEGLLHCRNELVVRMDSDDVSLPDRCQRQIARMMKEEELVLLSASVREFCGTVENVIGQRRVPLRQEEILRYSRRRNPFNHPAVVFRKSVVEELGGYREKYHLFEDYDLWVRILRKNYKTANLEESLLCMRVDAGMYERRGGGVYAACLLHFHRALYKSSWSSFSDFYFAAVPHAVLCILPVWVRRAVYRRLHG